MFNSTWTPIADVVSAARAVVERWERGDLAEAVRELNSALDELDASVATDEETMHAVRIHESDECSIDCPTLVSRSDDGYWVSASLFVPSAASQLTHEQKIVVLRSYGFIVGDRDPARNVEHPGKYMVLEADDDPEAWCVVGDSIEELVDEAMDLVSIYDRFNEVCTNVLNGGDGRLA